MHIGFFSGDITRSGGTDNVSVMISNELSQKTDCEISFISLFEERDIPFFSINPAIQRFRLYPTATHGIQHYFDTCKRLRNIVAMQHIDVLVDIDCILDMYSLPLRKTGVKVVSWEHFNYLQNPGVPYRKLTRRWAARSADAIVTLTETDKKLYQSNLKLKCPIVAIPNPMETPDSPVSYDANSHLILSSGRLTYQKGFDLLVEVASKGLPDHPDWTWMVLGEGEDRPMLEQKIRDAHLNGRLVLKGRVDDVDSYYRRSAMFVMTSRFEGLPMVLLEAKAHRLPLVSFDCLTGPAEIIEDWVNGTLVPPEDVDSMAAAVNELIENRTRRVEYSAMSGSNANRYDINTIITQWKSLLKKVLHG